MAQIMNDRDVLLQGAAVRFVPPQINPDNIPGYNGVVSNVGSLNNRVDNLEGSVNHLMNTSKVFFIRADALTFVGSSAGTTPATITLTAERGGITGTMVWSVFAGIATLSGSGDSRSVSGTTVTGQSATIRARITNDEGTHDAYVTLTRLGAIAAADKVNLTNQVVGTLANENVGGLGALALLNSINLSTQTTGKLNGATQVTNLGTLAYANAIAANQIGAGQLAAGVIYAGEINADNITSGTITGRTIQTAVSYPRVRIDSSSNSIFIETSAGENSSSLSPGAATFDNKTYSQSPAVSVFKSTGSGAALRVIGSTTGPGMHVQLKIGATYAPIRMDESVNLPTSRAAGNICFYDGTLCYANGEHWYRSDGTYLG